MHQGDGLQAREPDQEGFHVHLCFAGANQHSPVPFRVFAVAFSALASLLFSALESLSAHRPLLPAVLIRACLTNSNSCERGVLSTLPQSTLLG